MTPDLEKAGYTNKISALTQTAEVILVRDALILTSTTGKTSSAAKVARDSTQDISKRSVVDVTLVQRPPWPSDPPSLAPSSSSTKSATSTTVITSYITLSASAPGQTPSVQTVTSVATIQVAPPTTASTTVPTVISDQGRGIPSSTKIALGVGIPVGLLFIIILIVVGFILGRRAAKSEKRDVNIKWRRLWKRGQEDKQVYEKPDLLCLSTSQEKHELAGDRPPQELPTEYNVQELPEDRTVVELPQKSPVEIAQRSPVELG